MLSFSQREGIKPIKKLLQLESIDSELRNRLWSCLDAYLWQNHMLNHTDGMDRLVKQLWFRYFKKPIDRMPWSSHSQIEYLRKHFFDAAWNEIFDFIEFIYEYGPTSQTQKVIKLCNSVLEEENSGYRFSNGQFIEITSTEELSTIQDASQTPYSAVNAHIAQAIELFSDRKTPDYRNSMKESISAVEAMCQILVKDDKMALGEALKALEKSDSFTLHGSLKAGFSKLYGYVSDADGIRHAMHEEPNLTFTDAKYMLVSCSAFVNYLIGKASELDLKRR